MPITRPDPRRPRTQEPTPVARDHELCREIALKELRPEQASSVLQQARFLREAQITGQLEHPGIVPLK
jgi:serine/threonine-protein kinase